MAKPSFSAGQPRSAGVYAAAFVALLLWAGTPIANKLAVASIDPATAGVARSALAGMLAALLAMHWRLPFPSLGRHRLVLAASSLASFAIWPLLLSFGLGRTSANHAALMIATIPVFTGLIAAAVDRRRPGAAWLVGVAIALCGAALLLAVRSSAAATTASVSGDAVIMAGVVACAAGYVGGGKLSPKLGALPTTLWSLALGTLVLIPALVILWPRTDWPHVGASAWLAIGYMAICSSLLGYLAWFWALGHGGITRISAWQLGQPVMTVVLAGFVLGERVTWPLVLAGAAVLAGTALTQLGGRNVAGAPTSTAPRRAARGSA
jgi:drug/metabolite transporter (DMT)-like permease